MPLLKTVGCLCRLYSFAGGIFNSTNGNVTHFNRLKGFENMFAKINLFDTVDFTRNGVLMFNGGAFRFVSKRSWEMTATVVFFLWCCCRLSFAACAIRLQPQQRISPLEEVIQIQWRLQQTHRRSLSEPRRFLLPPGTVQTCEKHRSGLTDGDESLYEFEQSCAVV